MFSPKMIKTRCGIDKYQQLKRDRSVLRYLTVSLCKDALEYNIRRAKGEFKKKKK